jgi:hypothetical protein
MKSLRDYRGEYRATCRRYGRAFNRWRRETKWTTETTALNARLHVLTAEMFAARDRYHAAINASLPVRDEVGGAP